MTKQYSAAPDLSIDLSTTYQAVIHTSEGDITVEFYTADAPQTVNNFLFLARDGFYDDVFASLAGLRWVPGRMEVIGAAAQRPTVVVDYAHTPDAVTKVLAALRPFCQGKLVCVVGCGGDRDVGKRPLMGAAAVAGADLVWLTSDNPRSEEPAAIIADMRQGTQAGAVFECLDRAEAIRQAVGQAEPLDVVLVAGKGHEAFQEVDGQYLPFDDRQVVADVLQELG